MRLTTRITLLLFLTLGLATASLAQEADESVEFSPLQVVTVVKNTTLRRGRSPSSAVIKTLKTNSQVRLLIPQSKSGSFFVMADKGAQGWVRTENVHLESPSIGVSEVTVESSANPPCADFESCTDIGCAEEGSEQAIFNQAKRHRPTGASPVPLTFSDLRSLQAQANDLVDQGKELSQSQRNRIHRLNVSRGLAGEGTLVKLSGFLINPHKSGKESVNCRLTKTDEIDFHIPLTRLAGQTEFDGIVVEMIPQERPSEWTIAKLKKIEDDELRVLVIGGLFYDNGHVVNKDPDNPINGQPKRFSLWEIHPITSFFVCEKAGNRCSINRLSDWTKLEDFE